MSGKFALIIGNTEYTDPGLAQLTAPGKDAEDFARILKDQEICAFDDVNVLLNQPSYVVGEAIDAFFYQKKPDDLLVVYFSGHGVRDEFGALYLAVQNTNRARLRGTAIRSDYIREAMDQSRSKRQVVILDCCNSGAFPQGTKAEAGGMMGLVSALQGYGRFVLTASDATQFAWEGDKLIGETQNSLFTHFLVKGLKGEADRNSDGKITVDELYDYAFDEISKLTPKQTPTKSISKQEGEIVLRQITHIEDIKPIALPEDLVSEVEDLRPYVREAAVQKLEKIVKGKNIGMARSAMEALEKIANDDNTTRRVAQMATQILETVRQAEKKAEEERRAREEAERLAALKAEEERLAREKAEAERKAKEEAEKLLRAQAAREEAEREAARLKAEREAAEKAAREAAHRAALEKAEREAAEQEAVQRAEREAMELAARRKAEREAAEQAEREAIELAARRKAEREAKARDTIEVPQATKRSFLTVGIIVTVTVFLIVCGYGMTRLIPLFFVVATPTSPAATEAPVIEPPLTEVPATEPSATKQPTVDITEPPFSVLSSDWPMENHDAARTGFNSAEHNLLPPLRELWNKSITDYYIDDIAVSEGKVALSGMSGSSENSTNQVYMLDATTGAILWNFTLSGGGGGAMNFTPAFGAKSIFFGGQGDTNLYSLNVDSGQVNWQRSGFNGLYASQIATDENRIYVPDEVKGVVAFDPNTGEPIWGNGVGAWGLPTAFRKGIVFGIKSDRGNLVALSETNGTELWQFSGLQAFFTWVVVDADRIYLNVSDSEIAALNISDGTLLWKTKLDINALSSHGPALMNGQLYIPFWTDQVDHGGVIALDTSTGEIHWNFSSGREGVVAVAAANDIVYATGWLSQTVYALSPLDGETLWSYSLGCNGGDLAIAESTLFVTSCDEIYAFINQN